MPNLLSVKTATGDLISEGVLFDDGQIIVRLISGPGVYDDVPALRFNDMEHLQAATDVTGSTVHVLIPPKPVYATETKLISEASNPYPLPNVA